MTFLHLPSKGRHDLINLAFSLFLVSIELKTLQAKLKNLAYLFTFFFNHDQLIHTSTKVHTFSFNQNISKLVDAAKGSDNDIRKKGRDS